MSRVEPNVPGILLIERSDRRRNAQSSAKWLPSDQCLLHVQRTCVRNLDIQTIWVQSRGHQARCGPAS